MMTKRLYFIYLSVFCAILSFSNSILAQGTSHLSTSYSVREDGKIQVDFRIKINRGWYLYSATYIDNGPMPATFELDAESPVELYLSLEDVGDFHSKYDPAFNVEVFYYQDVANFSQLFIPLEDGPFVLKGYLIYQTCNGEECLINEEQVEITIDPTGAKVKNYSANVSDGSSLLLFLLIAFAAGLGGVVTPCVFPMIPMTVGFLIGGASSKRDAITKGVVFGLSVVLIYTALGLIVSLFGSTAATDALGTHWIPNLIFALLFLVFSISFLGAFEIVLPSGLANKADKRADKGGILAAFFVALAMVIVSFSCTGPFVGSILAAGVVGGVALKPILGMAVFGFAFSLPFVLCSFFPALMKKMPKSGGWLNVVKVVFAFVLLAFAVKFFYNVDAYFGAGIITRAGFISIWVVLSILLSLYFLGIIRTKHDTPVDGLGWGRVFAAIVTLSFALYMIPGLFGAPLKSISGFIPPMDDSVIVVGNASNESGDAEDIGYSSIKSYSSLDEAILASKRSGKPIFIAFKSHTCSVCKVMESTVLSSPTIVSQLKKDFIVANLYVDDKSPDPEYKTLGRRYRKYQTEKFGSASQPLYVIIDSSENVLSGPLGSCEEELFCMFMNY